MTKFAAFRKYHLSIAEAVDAWRIIPRILIAGYAFMLYIVIDWYMKLEPYFLDGCDVSILAEKCLIDAPTTSHSILVSAVVGVASMMFTFYVSSGRKWASGIKFWKEEEVVEEVDDNEWDK